MKNSDLAVKRVRLTKKSNLARLAIQPAIAKAVKTELVDVAIGVELGRNHRTLLEKLRSNSTGKLKIIYSNLSKMDRRGFNQVISALVD